MSHGHTICCEVLPRLEPFRKSKLDEGTEGDQEGFTDPSWRINRDTDLI